MRDRLELIQALSLVGTVCLWPVILFNLVASMINLLSVDYPWLSVLRIPSMEWLVAIDVVLVVGTLLLLIYLAPGEGEVGGDG